MSSLGGKQKKQTGKNVMRRELDALLKTRFHGAVNIRGIRYQILYSLLRAFDLYAEDDGVSSIRLEGIEDVDLLGLRLGNVYIQVKTSQDSWKWSQLKDPIQGFLQVYRADPDCRFVLAVDFELRTEIAKLVQLKSLSPKEKKRIEDKFRTLCYQIGATTSEADGIASRLTITSQPEKKIEEQLKQTVTETFELGSGAVDIYILVLVSKFLDWAKDRKTVTRTDLDSVRAKFGENLAREREFQAYGRGLIDRISWESDANITDFFDGKGTRPGHIAANIDVKRPKWLEKINKAIDSSKICILRSSSGQGKSALLYRYAYEQWPAENTFSLQVVETQEHVEGIRNYLQFRAKLGLPIYLLIDNAGWRTRLWPLIAQECAALGVRVLVTVRNEDWHRFARESLTSYEILEPTLDSDEARHIFKIFQSEGRLHAPVDSPEWAYERIGEPHLLIEYVYLLTHGCMLEERLRDQMKQFSEQNEDPAKIEILRRTALADTLGAPLLVDKLLKNIQLRDDPQQVLKSLAGEYVTLEGGIITGLHGVRSDHLAQILHEGYPDPANTALAILEAIPPDGIPRFISNAMCWQNLDVDLFIKGLIEKAKDATLGTILAFLDGIFEAGERQFFKANQGLFDEAYELIGPDGTFLQSSDFLPVVKVDTIDQRVKVLGDKGENFRKLQEIASKASKVHRGLDLCRNFLSTVSPCIQPESLQGSHGDTGRMLDWCSLCESRLPAWPTVRDDDFLACTEVISLPLDAFCNFTQGFYRYDETAYRNWFSQNREDVLGYLKLHTDSIELKVSDSALSIEFFPDLENSEGCNEQAVYRLKNLRSAIPFCKRYQSKGIWLLPFGLMPSVDETHKDIQKENLPFESDIEKNVVWRKAVASHYLPNSYYRYEEAWYTLRYNTLLFVQGLSKGLQRILTGRKFNFQSVFEEGQLLVRVTQALKCVPSLSADDLETIGKTLSQPLKEVLKEGALNKWHSSFQNFFVQICQYLQKRNMNTGRLAVHNFLDAVKHLPEMHAAFAQLFKEAPDYFNASELDTTEIMAYRVLADLLDAWILDPPRMQQRDILRYVRAKRERKRQEMLHRIRSALATLEEEGISIILPADVHVNHPLLYLPLAFSVDDPCHPENELEVVIDTLVEVKDIVDFFCLVPIHKGSRFLEGGYQISSDTISQLEEDHLRNWEALVPRELPGGVLGCLPPLPFQVSARLQIRTNVFAILSGMQAFGEQKNKIETLRTSRNHFEVELYNRHKVRLHELEMKMGTSASEVKEFLNAEFASLQEDSTYKRVWCFLETVEEASQQGTVDDLLMSSSFDVEGIVDSLEQLRNSE
ncbi:hypothetical protein C5S39_05060 [Candidatus Methanophagaceae archaeon]|nr:hypothetical protein C5S39_05060 [Methanophagales archaeon]